MNLHALSVKNICAGIIKGDAVISRRAVIYHNDVIERTLMLMTQTFRLVNKYIDAYFYKKAHLSLIKFLVFKILASEKEGMTPSQLAEWTQTELHNITTLVARLKRDGFVSTERNNVDKRSVNVILTDKGRKTLEDSIPVAREIIRHIMSSITEPEAIKCSQILEVLKDNAYKGLRNISRNH
jgi:DNA-binding MarR family transcriptional regulator